MFSLLDVYFEVLETKYSLNGRKGKKRKGKRREEKPESAKKILITIEGYLGNLSESVRKENSIIGYSEGRDHHRDIDHSNGRREVDTVGFERVEQNFHSGDIDENSTFGRAPSH